MSTTVIIAVMIATITTTRVMIVTATIMTGMIAATAKIFWEGVCD